MLRPLNKHEMIKGTLVHVPQSVTLLEYEQNSEAEPQLNIPLRFHTTEKPTIGVVTGQNDDPAYVRIFCNGDEWTVKGKSIYALSGEEESG